MNKYSLESLGIVESGMLAPGRVALANESAFNAAFLSQPLTDYAIGWKTEDNKLEEFLEFLAPGVCTPRKFEYRVGNNADAFAAVADGSDVRSLYGEYKLVKTTAGTQSGKTVSKGLSTLMERDEEREVPNAREGKVAWLKRMLLRAEVIRSVSLLNTAATNSAKTWTGTNGSMPDIDLMAAIDAFGDAVGIDANRVLLGSSAWTKRIGAYASKEAKNFVPPATLQGLADFLGVEKVVKSSERYTTGTGKSKLVTADCAFIFMGMAGATSEDPSTLKRFWTPKEGGEWVVYVDEKYSDELIKITVAHASQIALTCSTGVQKLTIS